MLGLQLHQHSSNQLLVYNDADWAGSLEDRWCMGGYLIYLGCNLISWSLKKQSMVAHSSTEVKYKAIANTVAELIWI